MGREGKGGTGWELGGAPVRGVCEAAHVMRDGDCLWACTVVTFHSLEIKSSG